MRAKEKSLWLGLMGKDDKEVERIQRARARRDDRFFDEWFNRYNKEGNFWIDDKVGRVKSKKNDWL